VSAIVVSGVLGYTYRRDLEALALVCYGNYLLRAYSRDGDMCKDGKNDKAKKALPQEGKVKALYKTLRSKADLQLVLAYIEAITDEWREGKISTRRAMDKIVDAVDKAVMTTWKE